MCVSGGLRLQSRAEMLSQAHSPILGEGQIEACLDKNPGAIREAMTNAQTSHGHTSDTQRGKEGGVSESLTRGLLSHTDHRQLND